MSLDNKVVDLADLKVSHDYLLEQDGLLSDRIDELGSGIDDVESIIGDLSNLSTTLKNNIVSAINEVLQTGGRVKSVNSKTGDVVLKTSDLTNDSGYLTSYTETDPTVPSWAKQQQKPSYTASEVGAATTEALTTEITTRTASDAQLQSQITALGNGAPIPVETVAEMIDNTKAYLYTGAEAGWLTGCWYTYDSAQAKFIPRGEYGVGTVIDATLTVSGDAADAKATGDAITEINGRLTQQASNIGDLSELDTEDKSSIVGAVNEALESGKKASVMRDLQTFEQSRFIQGTFNEAGSTVSSQTKIRVQGFIPVKEGDIFTFTQGTKVTGVRYGVYSESRTWVRTEPWQDESGDYIVTADGYLIIVCRKTGDANITPSDYDATIIQKRAAGIEDLFELVDGLYDEENIEKIPVQFDQSKGYIIGYGSSKTPGSVATDTTALTASDYVCTKGYKALLVRMPKTAETSTNVCLCFYDKDKTAIKNSVVNVFCGRTSGDAYSDYDKIYIPCNAEYFRTSYWTDAYISANCPTEVFECYGIKELIGSDEPITHEMPINETILHVVRRARQLTDVEWTPLMDIPRYSMIEGEYSGASGTVHFLDWFKAGKTYKGVPYSGSGCYDIPSSLEPGEAHKAAYWGYYHMYVGPEISFETFITAARTPGSIMSSKENQSVYHYDSSPYGIVCNGFVGNAFNFTSPFGWPNRISAFYKIGNVSSMDINDIRIGDVLQYSTIHVVLVTDIVRDENGNVTLVEVAEATTVGNNNNTLNHGESAFGGICRRKFWTVDELKSWNRMYEVYRYELMHEISYTPSDYVDTGNEGDRRKHDDLPCVPYLGNKARYQTGKIYNSKIIINASGFTSLVVKKDGEDFGTFDVTGLSEIEVGFTDVGEYSAYLAGTNTKTMSCEWTVVTSIY